MPQHKYHISARPLRQGDKKKAEPYGAIVPALNATNALTALCFAIAQLPIGQLDALTLTVERTSEDTPK